MTSPHQDLEDEAAKLLAYACERSGAQEIEEVALTMALQSLVRAFVRQHAENADLNRIAANDPALTKGRRSLMIALATVCFTPGATPEARRKHVIQVTHDLTMIAGNIDAAHAVAAAMREGKPN